MRCQQWDGERREENAFSYVHQYPCSARRSFSKTLVAKYTRDCVRMHSSTPQPLHTHPLFSSRYRPGSLQFSIARPPSRCAHPLIYFFILPTYFSDVISPLFHLVTRTPINAHSAIGHIFGHQLTYIALAIIFSYYW